MPNQILKTADDKMQEAVLFLLEELKKIRTGRASAAIFEDIKVSYYGAPTSLKELASIMIPEPTQIQIKPFDKNAIGDIETAIKNSDLGLNPVNDGNYVRISLPPLTEERRKELAVQVKKVGESAKVTIRNVRADAWGKVKDGEKKGELTEDDKYRSEKNLNELINKMNKEVDLEIGRKEEEIMSI